jgi:hypothetical protein
MKWIIRSIVVIVMIIGWCDIAVLHYANKKLLQDRHTMLSILVQEQEICEEKFLHPDNAPVDASYNNEYHL